jgi:hypothetical protein
MAVLPRYGYLWIVALCLLASPARQASAVPTRRLPLEHATTVRSTATNQPRTACSFYLWNSPSALLRKWCRHLMKDCVYEGRGGVKVRSYMPSVLCALVLFLALDRGRLGRRDSAPRRPETHRTEIRNTQPQISHLFTY